MAGILAACDPAGDAGDPRLGESRLALDAYCDAEVDGSGVLDVENDYLPQVVACENGAAPPEALAAQAVAARSFLYYKLAREGHIGDGQGDQVYTCGNPAGDEHRRAVEETSGIVLGYRGVIVAAFYVAGALQDPPDCTGGASDPTGTEPFVTYNEGRSGADIDQTSLGLVDPDNFENRGCQSQNGASCLARAGRDFPSILRFYYGEDIELIAAEGPCVIGSDPPPPDDPPPPGDPDDPPPGDPDDPPPGDPAPGDAMLAGGGGCSATSASADGARDTPGAPFLALLPAVLAGLWLARPSLRARAAPAASPSPGACRCSAPRRG